MAYLSTYNSYTSYNTSDYVYGIVLCVAFAVWVGLSFTQKRSKILKGCCYGRPGLVPPVNFLMPRHRLIYTVACAAQTSLWLTLLFESYRIDVGPVSKWLSLAIKALVLLIAIGLVAMLTYPLLACMESPVPIIGYSLGLFYSIIYLGFRLFKTYNIFSPSLSEYDSSYISLIIGLIVAVLLPETVFLVIVIIWYGYMWGKEIIRLLTSSQCNEIFPSMSTNHHYVYVKKLLKKDLTKRRTGFIYLHKNVSLPLPVLIASSVSITAVFQLLAAAIITFPYLSEAVATLVEDQKDSALDTVADFLHSLTAVIVIALSLSTILIVLLLIHLLHTIRKDTLLIRRGKSNLTKNIRNIKWPAIKLTSFVRYCGYQIASIIMGWMFYSIVFFIIGSFFLGFYISPEFFGYILYFIGLSVLIVVSAIVIEGLMCKFIFLSSESNQKKTIIITNRRAFSSFFYCVLLYNVATGLFTSTIRLVIAFLLALLVKPRLDRILFISPFQLLDSGHSMYKSFMITEALFHNPVVNVFAQLISPGAQISQKPMDNTNRATKNPNQGHRFSQRAKNRWFLAYTLLNNKSLIQSRSTHVEQGQYMDDHAANSPYYRTVMIPVKPQLQKETYKHVSLDYIDGDENQKLIN